MQTRCGACVALPNGYANSCASLEFEAQYQIKKCFLPLSSCLLLFLTVKTDKEGKTDDSECHTEDKADANVEPEAIECVAENVGGMLHVEHVVRRVDFAGKECFGSPIKQKITKRLYMYRSVKCRCNDYLEAMLTIQISVHAG